MKQNKVQEEKKWIRLLFPLEKNTDTDTEAGQVQSHNIYLVGGGGDPRLTDIETGGGQNHNIIPNTGKQHQQ